MPVSKYALFCTVLSVIILANSGLDRKMDSQGYLSRTHAPHLLHRRWEDGQYRTIRRLGECPPRCLPLTYNKV